MKQIFLIILFLSFNSFNAQNSIPEKTLRYYGAQNDKDFFKHLIIFSGNIIVSPIRDNLYERYNLIWGIFHKGEKMIYPAESLSPITFDYKKASRIRVDYLHKEVLDIINKDEGETHFVMYITPRFDNLYKNMPNTKGTPEYHTAILLSGEEVLERAKQCSDYIFDNMAEEDKSGTYDKMNSLGELLNIYTLMDSHYRKCVSEKLEEKIENRFNEWGILNKKSYFNW